MATKKGLSLNDDDYYEVDLLRSVEYPPGSRRMIPAGAKVTMKGKAVKLIEQDVADARPKPK